MSCYGRLNANHPARFSTHVARKFLLSVSGGSLPFAMHFANSFANNFARESA
jgi:hypothetical protein